MAKKTAEMKLAEALQRVSEAMGGKSATALAAIKRDAAEWVRPYEDALAERDELKATLARVMKTANAVISGTIGGYDQQIDNLSKKQIGLLWELESSLKEVKL